jgi:hypothetical protein
MCVEILGRHRDAVRRKHLEKRSQNSTSEHLLLVVKKYLAKHIVMTLEHLTYSPILLLPEFILLQLLNIVLERQ